MGAVDTARENATLREEFLRRGLAPEEALNRLGWVSHADLDLWAQAGVLELGVAGLSEAWGLGKLHGDIFNRRIVRGRGGRFEGTIGGEPIKPQSGRRIRRNAAPRVRRSTSSFSPRMPDEPIAKLKGRQGSVKGKKIKVYATPHPPGARDPYADLHKPGAMSWEQYKAEADPIKKVHAAGRTRLKREAEKARAAGVAATASGDHDAAREHHAKAVEFKKALKDPAQTLTHGQAELYQTRSAKLEKRIQRNVGKAGEAITPAAGGVRGEHDLSAAEAHFNDAGRVSQKTLLAYAEEAARQPTTAEMYRDKNGNYHPSRKVLHAAIIDRLLRQHATNEEGRDAGLSGDAPYLKAPDGAPTVIFTGGGYASGKGSVVKRLHAENEWPSDALLLDPDLIKAELPEFQLAAMNDPEANLRVYSEAWDIAQETMKQAQERGLNVVVDGITDTGADEVAQRVKTFTDKGYVNPRIYYVSVATDEAIKRAQSRAAKGNTAADRRMIPEVIMRAVHRDVSATIPGVMARAKEMGAEVHVFDTDQGKDEATGQFNPAKLVAHASAEGQIHLPDANGYQAILNKSQESIKGVPDVTVAPTDIWKSGGQDLTIRPGDEKKVGAGVVAALPRDVTGPSQPQPVGGKRDPGELMRVAAAKGLPAYRKLLDLGGGIVAKLGGSTQDVSEGKDFKQVGQDIQNHMDEPHVIIAPVKSLQRGLDKAAANGTPGDLTQLHDVVRATVTMPTAQDLPGAIDKIVKEAEGQGWKVERQNPRLVNAEGNNRQPTNGYGDTSLILRGPPEAGGLLTELLVNTNPMWWTKEIGPGHGYYELERQIAGRAQAEGRPETPAEQKLLDEIRAAAKPLYDRAWGASLNGGGTNNIRRVVIGDAAEQARAKKELAELATRTRGLMTQAPTPAVPQRQRRAA